jgi:hypothetical protein
VPEVFISRRENGFRIQINDKEEIYFKRDIPTEVPDKYCDKVRCYMPQFVELYQKPVPAPPPVENVVVEKIEVAEVEPELPDATLDDLPKKVVNALKSEGIHNKNDLLAYVDEGKSLSGINGITPQMEERLIASIA